MKRGRPKNYEERIKKSISFDKENYLFLEEKQHQLNYNFFSDFVQDLCMKKAQNIEKNYLKKEISLYRLELKRVGTNVNQIAKKLNQGGIFTNSDLKHLEELRELLIELGSSEIYSHDR